MKTLDNYKFENATYVSCQTLVAVISKSFPLPYGNCFSVQAESGSNYKIVNFVLENLQQLLDQKTVTWPIKILPLSSSVAVIMDERIPEECYSDKYCEICCPFDLLPHNQRMEHVRKLLRGDIEELECSNGLIAVKYINKLAEQGVTITYTSASALDSSYVCCDYIPSYSLK